MEAVKTTVGEHDVAHAVIFIDFFLCLAVGLITNKQESEDLFFLPV